MSKLQKTTTLQAPLESTVCDKHGEYDPRQLNGKCPVCAEINRKRAEYVNAFKSTSGVPKRFLSARFSNFDTGNKEQEKASKACEKYAVEFEDCLKNGRSGLMLGTCGTGKTHLACSIATAIAYQMKGMPRYMTMVQAIRSVKQTYSKGSDKTEAEAIRQLVEPDLLILDEVGVQYGTDAEKIIVSEIINDRYNDMKPTILVSNLTTEDFVKFLGIRVIDRMKESCGLYLEFSGDSYRGRK